MTAAPGSTGGNASLKRRLLSLLYESLLLAAVLLAGTLPVVMLTRTWDPAIARTVLQLSLLGLCGLYCVWQWIGAGQTLPMKTWRLRVVTPDGAPLTAARATARYALALVSTFMLGLGFVWALLDREHLFLHDRLAGTRIINTR